MFPEIMFDCRTIPDRALQNLRKFALENVTETSPIFGEWLRKWAETEQYWRATDPDHRPARHAIALPLACDWLNKELADALNAVTTLSYLVNDESLGTLIDRIVFSIVGETMERLEKHV